MTASTSTAVPAAEEEDGLLLRAVVMRTAQEVKDYTTQYEDQRKLVDAIDTAMKAPENKSVLDILAVRERRLDVALVRELNAIANFTNFCIAERVFCMRNRHRNICSGSATRCRRYYYYGAIYIKRHRRQEDYEKEAAGIA